MKILTGIDIPYNPFGGSPIICDDWYSCLPYPHKSLFLTMKPSEKKRWWKIKNVKFLKTTKVRDQELYPKYISELNKEVSKIINIYKPDVIHMQHLNYGLSRSFSEICSNIPKIAICHGTDTQIASQSPFFFKNLEYIADKANMIVFPTKEMANDFFLVYKKPKKHIIIPHGIPEQAFNKHKIHKKEQLLKMLYAGRLNYFKGADIAIKSLCFTNSPIHLDIIGNEDQKNFLQELHNIVDQNRLQNKVSFTKQITRVSLWKKFSNYDVIVVPSRSLEAFSLTAIEAQARGLVVIYGNGGGITNVVGKSGLIINDNRPETLAIIIDKLNNNRNLIIKYRKLGYENAKKYKIARQISSLIKSSEKLVRDYSKITRSLI
ncbi:MAG TPA: glycosyltransferase family 4 protein [Patescibacteria group bacterium]|nr:glycosyltransferase family 4 protein [Patescibacteria group bacterium]